MNIGMILDKTFPPDPRVENEALSLIKNGHQVFLFCLKYSNVKSIEDYKGIQVRRYQSNKLEYKLSALAYTVPFYSMFMSKKIHHFLIENSIEAIHIHDIRIAEAVFQSNKKYKLPVVLDLHDNLPEIMKFYPHLQKFPGKYLINPNTWKKKEHEFVKKADKVITVSPEFIEEIGKRIPSAKQKLKLVPNTILSSFYSKAKIDNQIVAKYKNDFVLLYLGDTHLRRGLLTAIKAIPLLKTKIQNLKLVIVGKNTTDTILKDKVNELEINNFVDFEGWQDVGLFPSYIVSSSICLSPLHRNIQHDVAYANKLFQYMCFSKPLLVSNATAQKRLVETHNAGLVHIEKNEEDFADKVLWLYNNSEKMKEFGVNGEHFVKNHFTWDHTSKELINLYQELQG